MESFVSLRDVAVAAVRLHEKYSALLKDTALFAIGNLGSKLILFLMVPVYSNFMSREQFGVGELVYSVGQLAMPVMSLAVYEGVLRFSLTDRENRPNVLLGALVSCGVSSILILAAAPVFGMYAGLRGWEWFLAAYSVLYLFATVSSNYLRAKGAIRLFVAFGLIQTLVLAACNLLTLVGFDMGTSGYLWSLLVSTGSYVVLTALFGGVFRDLRKAVWSPQLLRKMLVFSGPLALNSASWWIIQSSGKVMLENIVGAAALGLFSVASKIPSLINVLISIFSQAWGISSIRDMDTVRDLGFYRRTYAGYQASIFLSASVCIAFSRELMSLIAGPSFRPAWIYVPLLLVAATFSAVSWFYGTLYVALKHTLGSLYTTIVGASVNLALSWVLITRMGIWGACIATAISYWLLGMIRLLDVSRRLAMPNDVAIFLCNCLVVAVQAALVPFSRWSLLWSAGAFTVLASINGVHVARLRRLASDAVPLIP